MTKHDFRLHSIDTAPEASRRNLEQVKQKFGRVPNFFAVAAESPAAVDAYVALSNNFRTTALSPAEQQIVILTASVENKCEYCVAAHSKGAKAAGVPEGVINAITGRIPLPDAYTEALRRLVSQIVEKRGWLADTDVQAFFGHGYTRAQLLDVMVGVSMKTLSNYIMSRSRKSAQGDKWSFCLTAGTVGPRIRRDHEQTSAPDAHTGLQGKGGACGHQGRADAGSAG